MTTDVPDADPRRDGHPGAPPRGHRAAGLLTGPDVLPVDLGTRVRAAFTTRTGGVSTGPWTGLNLGQHVADEPSRVRANRELLQHWVGAPVAFMDQRHGAEVIVVDRPPRGRSSVGVADALVTTRADVALAVLVADCVPVLLADGRNGVVGVVHVGREGLVAGVLPAALAALAGAGAQPASTTAVLGPSICGRCYEVPAVMRDAVDAAVPGTASTTTWGTPALDLPAGVRAQLAAAGVGAPAGPAPCTRTDPRFFSHRRDGAVHPTGRFAGVVRLLPAGAGP